MYETSYGIFDHSKKLGKRPMASVAMHESEDVNKGSFLQEAIDTFVKRNIKDTFGLSILEYLELPSDICAMLTETAIRKQDWLQILRKN
jgi:hypothetical protein